MADSDKNPGSASALRKALEDIMTAYRSNPHVSTAAEITMAKIAEAALSADAALSLPTERNIYGAENHLQPSDFPAALSQQVVDLASIKNRLDIRLNAYLCDMKPDHDDSITGFNEAWDIMRKFFAEIPAAPPAQVTGMTLNLGEILREYMRAHKCSPTLWQNNKRLLDAALAAMERYGEICAARAIASHYTTQKENKNAK